MNYLKQMATICFAFATMVVSSQELSRQIVSTSGGQSQAPTFDLSWTIGQAGLAGTYTNGGTTLCVGFQQSDLLSTNIAEQYSDELKIFPNPCSDFLYINMTKQEQTDVILKLMDSYGRIRYEQSFTFSGSLEHKINISVLPHGMYYLEMKTNTKMITEIKTSKLIHY
jgi:hypothetical protein